MNELAIINPAENHRLSTDVAEVCKQIVTTSALTIQGRKYVRVEGWQSIATAHGCIASSRDVERVEGGVRAIGEIKRMSDGAVLSTAEGFVGEDETTWYGGPAMVWDKELRRKVEKVMEKRPDYAIRAMAQTRAISRACRSAFAHVVVLMDAGLSTTPAEEVPHGGFDEEPRQEKAAAAVAKTIPGAVSAHEPEEDPFIAGTYESHRDSAKPLTPARPLPVTPVQTEIGTNKAESKISGIIKKQGQGPKGPWTRWDLTFEDGTRANTFSEELAELALDANRKRTICAYDVRPANNPKWAADLIDLMPVIYAGSDDLDMEPATKGPF